jgi:hypothetical protein
MPTVKELREEAKAKNLRGYSTMNKGQLEELLRKAATPVSSSSSVPRPVKARVPAGWSGASAVPASASAVPASASAVPTSTKRYVRIGEINVEGGEMVLVAPELLIGEYNYDKVLDLADKGNLFQLGTGGDGSFSIYEVYLSDQEDNLPQEYRIPIVGDPYEKVAISRAANEKILEAQSLARNAK